MKISKNGPDIITPTAKRCISSPKPAMRSKALIMPFASWFSAVKRSPDALFNSHIANGYAISAILVGEQNGEIGGSVTSSRSSVHELRTSVLLAFKPTAKSGLGRMRFDR